VIQAIYHRDALSLPSDYAGNFDVMLTDPPYSDHVHKNATSQSKGRGTRKRELGFESLSRKARKAVGTWAASVKRWSIVYSDVEHSNWLSLAVQARGTEYIRTMPWVRWSMPQLSGDRPPQGFEHVLCFHPKGRKHWNGPGNLTHLAHLALRGEEKHKCEKPLDQALDIVSFFSDVGESIFDPFAGNGTFGLACRLLGRNYVGIELDQEWAARAQARIGGAITDRDTERVARWLSQDSEPVSALKEGPSLARAAARSLDKSNVRTGAYL
jgi:site-specific DNA-methyltransferase (adenine-specific)